MQLKDQVAIVTGGSRGIGRAVALHFAREGANVVVVGREQAVAEEVARTIEQDHGRPALAVPADVSDAGAVSQVVQATLDRFGQVDILAACAGIIAPTLFLDISEEQWDRVMAINLKGTFLCMQAVLPHMQSRGTGRIITTTSLPGMKSVGGADYAVSKAGIIMLTEMVARELRQKGSRITVNCVSPVAETRMSEALAEFRGETMEQFRARRLGSQMPGADDVANSYVFLASALADHITGQVLAVDDGRSL